MDDPVEDAIEDAALAPKQVDTDGTTTVEQSIPDLITAADRKAAVTAAANGVNPWGMLRPARVIPPGGC